MPSIFVRPRDTRHRPNKHRRSKTVNFSLKYLNRKLLVRSIIILIVGLGVVYGVYLMVMRSSNYRMDRITIVASGANPYTINYDKTLQQALQGKYYLTTKFNSTLKQLISQYPPIADLSLTKLSQGQYRLEVSYFPVQTLIGFDQKIYGIASGVLYPVRPETTGFVLEIPRYFTGMTLSGMFYQVSAPKLVQQYQTIIRGLADQDIQRMRYHVGDSQIQVNTTTQEIYIDIAGNVFEQLKKYRTLGEYRDQLPAQRIIDVGSLAEGAYIYP